MKKKNKRVLVLNVDYTPMSVCEWQEAITGVFKHAENYKHGVEIVDFYRNDAIKDSAGRFHPLPAVVRTLMYVKSKKTVPFSRKNVFIRDKMACQYCGDVFDFEDLTYDHVMPRAKWDNRKHGTPTHWENIVTACKPCNNRKGDKTLKECGMKPLKVPAKPPAHLYIAGLSPWNYIPDELLPYLPDVYKVLMHS